MQDSCQFLNFIWNHDLVASNWCVEMNMWHHNHQHATSRDASKGTIILKYFSCIISSELKIFARCKKNVLYFSSVHLHLIETNLYTISLARKLLRWNKCFAIFEFLMNVKFDFHNSCRQKCPVKYIWYLETSLSIIYKASCPISSVYGPILAYYK